MAGASRSAESRGAPAGVAIVDARRCGERPRDVQRLDGVDVSESRHDLLIEQRRLERRALARARPRQRLGVEGRRQRLGAEPAQRRGADPASRSHEVHEPEPPRIVEDDLGPRRQVEHDVIVRVAAIAGRPSATRNEPDMPRCISRLSPDESAASRYFARRVSSSVVAPASRRANRRGNGARKSGRRSSTRSIRAPTITGSSCRRTASTSGSSGTCGSQHRMCRAALTHL